MATIRIGISGWRYAPWRGPFYPPELPQRAELEYASRKFSTIEINGSFYSLQRPQSYARWYAETPEHFVFSVKAPRYITHVRRLREVRHAIEIRHESFLDPSFVDLLREQRIALVIAETARRWPMAQDVTADFVYLRLHGDKELYRSGYSDRALDRWARRIRAWHEGGEPADARKPAGARKISAAGPPAIESRDVFCYFDNTDVKLRAPADAQTLMRKLGLAPAAAEPRRPPHARRPHARRPRNDRQTPAVRV